MDEVRRDELAHLWYEVMWSRPDLALAERLVDPAYAPAWVHIDAVGPAQVQHEIRYFRSVFPDLRYRIVEQAVLPDRVWIRYQATGTQAGPAWGFPATGKAVTFEGATILYVNLAGQVRDRWSAYSFYDILVNLELAPPLWELRDHLQAARPAGAQDPVFRPPPGSEGG